VRFPYQSVSWAWWVKPVSPATWEAIRQEDLGLRLALGKKYLKNN
jgi:hypothetical protein